MTDDDGIGKLLSELSETWNRADWTAFSKLFSEDADYVTAAGVRLHGGPQIHAEMESRASQGLLSKVVITCESVRLPAPDIAVVICSWRMGSGCRARAGLMTVVSRKTGEAWQIIALHNTDQPR
jgi:uncharacterized protein (TIGR02246 family)